MTIHSAVSPGTLVQESAETDLPIQLFSTCPPSSGPPEQYLDRVVQTARWSEDAGCVGMLIYTDNTLLDPWLIAHVILQNTKSLCPLVAVQPVYMHPYSVAKIVATFGHLYGRRVFLNMVAGGFKNDLTALGDPTPHDSRYHRLVEYTTIIQGLIEGPKPLTFEGQFYNVRGLTLHPSLAPELRPGYLISGSSEAGQQAARQIGAIPVKYPEPLGPDAHTSDQTPCGARIGIIARPDADEAWAIATERFPIDRKGQLTRQLATKISDSVWHKQLAEVESTGKSHGSTYWLHPFENYQTNCPYFVGSYRRVADELSRYFAHGFRTFILDIPHDAAEFDHLRRVFDLAWHRVAA